MMLRARCRGRGPAPRGTPLNDVVVGAGGAGTGGPPGGPGGRRPAHHLRGGRADYCHAHREHGLRAGGGRADYAPQQRNILLVPVAPHTGLDRAVVLAEGVRVRVVVREATPRPR